MPSSDDHTASETVTAETFVVQALEELPDAVQRYASGDKSAFSSLKEKAIQLAAGQVGEEEINTALASKFGDGL